MRNAPSPLRDLVVDERFLPASAFAYVQCEVPASMTLDEWRRARNRARHAAQTDGRGKRRVALGANLRRWIGQR